MYDAALRADLQALHVLIERRDPVDHRDQACPPSCELGGNCALAPHSTVILVPHLVETASGLQDGEMPLHKAARCTDSRCVRVLLEAGASATARNNVRRAILKPEKTLSIDWN